MSVQGDGPNEDRVLTLATPDDRYKEEVIECLERLLRAARNGEVLSILYACERPGGAVTIGSTTIKDRYMMLGYLANQMYILHQSIDDTSVPSDLDEDGDDHR